MISHYLRFVKPPRSASGFLHKLTLFNGCGIMQEAESFAAKPPERGGCFMEQLILYIILAFIILEIFKTIKK